eukprot:gene7396-8645_t
MNQEEVSREEVTPPTNVQTNPSVFQPAKYHMLCSSKLRLTDVIRSTSNNTIIADTLIGIKVDNMIYEETNPTLFHHTIAKEDEECVPIILDEKVDQYTAGTTMDSPSKFKRTIQSSVTGLDENGGNQPERKVYRRENSIIPSFYTPKIRPPATKARLDVDLLKIKTRFDDLPVSAPLTTEGEKNPITTTKYIQTFEEFEALVKDLYILPRVVVRLYWKDTVFDKEPEEVLFNGLKKTLTSTYLTYEDFIFFARKYWFRCIDFDCDGVLSFHEMEYFYNDQKDRLDSLNLEPPVFTDLLCQILDMIKPSSMDRITLIDLKRSKLAGYLYNILFNTTKFFIQETKESVVCSDQSMGEWNRFAKTEYEKALAEESYPDDDEQDEDDEEEEEEEEDSCYPQKPQQTTDNMSTTITIDNPILIIGAGIGGLSLAQGLKSAGIPCRVYERDGSADYRTQGYRLRINHFGATALKSMLSQESWELFESTCADTKVGMTAMNAIDAVVSRSVMGQGGDPSMRAIPTNVTPMGPYTADRQTLRNFLLLGLEKSESPNAYVEFGKKLDHFEIISSGKVTAHFTDGSVVEGCFIVGADGVRSVVRRQQFPDLEVIDTTGRAIFGKTLITDALKNTFPSDAMQCITAIKDSRPLTLFLEPVRWSGANVGEASQGRLKQVDDYIYWVLAACKPVFGLEDEEFMNLTNKDTVELALKLTELWDPRIRSLFQQQSAEHTSALKLLSTSPTMPVWESSSSVSFVGDSIHPMPPAGGSGANCALRDAANLLQVIKHGITKSSISDLWAQATFTCFFVRIGWLLISVTF